MFGGPQGTGGIDSEADAQRQRERIQYPSIWREMWWAVVGLFRLPGRIMNFRRGRRR